MVVRAKLRAVADVLPWVLVGRALTLLLIFALVVVPVASASDFELGRVELALIFLMGAISLNFAFGYGGKLAIGQPLLITVAAYTAGILSKDWQLDLWQTMPFAVAAAVLTNLLLGIPSFRVQGWYLAIIAFFAVSIVPNLVLVFQDVTGGSDGLSGGIRPVGFNGVGAPGWLTYEVILLAAILSWVGMRNLVNSGWGVALRVSRDHPIASTAAGVSNFRLWAWIYVLSAIPCGVAGALFVHSQQFISADNFGTTTILLFIGSVFLGGPGTLWGPVVGVAVFQGLSLYLGPFSPYNNLALGLGVLMAALLFRGGIIRILNLLLTRLTPHEWRGLRLTTSGSQPIPLSPLETSPVVAVKGLRKHFGGNVVLQGVNLEFRGGEVVAVVGPNGSGKTTLLNVISGFAMPDEGEVVINGRSVTREPPTQRAGMGVGRTFQVPKLVASLSIVQNVEEGVIGAKMPSMVAALLRLPGFHPAERERRKTALEACANVGFSEQDAELDVDKLPLGLKHMVEIARVLAGKATIVCLDEPVAGLNPAEQGQVSAIARRIADSGRVVLLIEHNLPFVLSVCDRMVLLIDGQVADTGPRTAALDASRPLGRYFQTFKAADNA